VDKTAFKAGSGVCKCLFKRVSVVTWIHTHMVYVICPNYSKINYRDCMYFTIFIHSQLLFLTWRWKHNLSKHTTGSSCIFYIINISIYYNYLIYI
jgi:hypothetical protein